MNIFFIRPTTRNIGNDIIAYATSELIYAVFGAETNIINVPALQGFQFGGLTSKQIYDINRLADAVVIGGGNLFENGQITYQAQAVKALNRPMMIMGISHGRIYGRTGELERRSDALSADAICDLVSRADVALVRDKASQEILLDLGAQVSLGGCPTSFLPANQPDQERTGEIIISVRHPSRMSVPPQFQWRIAEDVRRLIDALKAKFSKPVKLACHDYIDLEFAAAFPEASVHYFDDTLRYISALRNCALNVTYRLHGFLPSLAFGTPSINLSYDERGRSMLETVGMGSWDIDLLKEKDCVTAIMDRASNLDGYDDARKKSMPIIENLCKTTTDGLELLRSHVQTK